MHNCAVWSKSKRYANYENTLETIEELVHPLVVMRQWRMQSGVWRIVGVGSGVYRSVYASGVQ